MIADGKLFCFTQLKISKKIEKACDHEKK